MDTPASKYDVTDAVPVTSLGFVVTEPADTDQAVAPSGKEMAIPDALEYAKVLAPAEREEFLSNLIRQNALTSVYEIQDLLAREGTDINVPRQHRLSILDQMVKLAKLDKRPQQSESTGGYQLVINIGDVRETHKSVVIEHQPIENAE